MSWDPLSEETSIRRHALNVISGSTVSLDRKPTLSFTSAAHLVPTDSYE